MLASQHRPQWKLQDINTNIVHSTLCLLQILESGRNVLNNSGHITNLFRAEFTANSCFENLVGAQIDQTTPMLEAADYNDQHYPCCANWSVNIPENVGAPTHIGHVCSKCFFKACFQLGTVVYDITNLYRIKPCSTKHTARQRRWIIVSLRSFLPLTERTRGSNGWLKTFFCCPLAKPSRKHTPARH